MYKGLYANHRSEGGTRLQRTVLRPESDVAVEHIAASTAQLRASGSRHRLDSSTTDAPIEPDFRVRPQRPSCHRRTVILVPSVIGTPLRKTLRSRSRSYALAPHATASIAAQRTPPPSPICAFGRGGRERHRSAASLRASFCTVTECHPSSPQRCPQTHRRWLRAHRALMRLLCAAAPRGLLTHCAITREHLWRSTPNSTKREAHFQQRCSGPHRPAPRI